MKHRLKVLVIEDQQDIRESICEILDLAGYETFQADNGRLGLIGVDKNSPDIILCDIMMPELDGLGVLHMLSRKPSTATIPFIFLTAKSDRLDIRKAMDMGADDYLIKPFDDIELLNAVECRLKKRVQQRSVLDADFDEISRLLPNTRGMDELKILARDRKLRQVKRKQVIYYDGDTPAGVYLVVSGRVKTFKVAEDGREFLTGLYGPQEYFGLVPFLLAEDYRETAEAVEDGSVCLLPKNRIDELIWKRPDVAASFLKIMANNVVDNEEQLLQLAYHSVRKRMAELLVRLRIKCDNVDLSTLNLSRDNLASMAGIATETVSRILGDFKNEGLISGTSNQIVILNSDKLERMKN